MFIVEEPSSRANISHNIRFDEETYEALKQVLCKHDVSFNSLVLQCCRYALEHLRDETTEE